MALSIVLAGAVLVSSQPVKGQGGVGQVERGQSIASQTEFGQGLVVRDISARTGRAMFATGQGRGVLLRSPARATAEARAMMFVEAYGQPFGIDDASQVVMLRRPHVDEQGMEHVRLQQLHRGIPVRGGEFVVHLNGARVMAANGTLISDLPGDVTPGIGAASAETEARGLIGKQFADRADGAQYSEPRLEILDLAHLSDGRTGPPRLVWFIEASGFGLREFIWVDAKSGELVLHFSQLTEAKSRRVYTLSHATTGLPGTLVRSEGGSVTGDADQDRAYDYSGLTWDYYSTITAVTVSTMPAAR